MFSTNMFVILWIDFKLINKRKCHLLVKPELMCMHDSCGMFPTMWQLATRLARLFQCLVLIKSVSLGFERGQDCSKVPKLLIVHQPGDPLSYFRGLHSAACR